MEEVTLSAALGNSNILEFRSSLVKIMAAKPEHCHVSTTIAEHQNLTMKMNMRRFAYLPRHFQRS